MYITNFAELAEVMMKRKHIKLKEVAEYIRTSAVYARHVIDGFYKGGKADSYKLEIADFLGIDRKYANIKEEV
ncbi:TPA: hypothetical protein IUX83_002423 [Enterococcus faecalis]|nr:hypothetical protein [Enterococcus faecalis]HAP4930782.1 hypothetical protein [Enterococcus faecalis]